MFKALMISIFGLLTPFLPYIVVGLLGFGGVFFLYEKVSSWGLEAKLEKLEKNNLILKNNQESILTSNSALLASIGLQNKAVDEMVKQANINREALLLSLGAAKARSIELDKLIRKLEVPIDEGKNKCENASIQAEQFKKEF